MSKLVGTRLRTVFFFCSLFLAVSLQGNARATETVNIEAIPQAQVREYILGLFRTPLIRKLAGKSGNIIAELIEKTSSSGPLFTYVPPQSQAARLNFTAYFRLLALRHDRYENPLIGDLYLLHELHHIATMPLGQTDSFEQWRDKIISNEKRSSFFSEVLLFLTFPEIRKAFPQRELWVDRFLDKNGLAKPDTNSDLIYKNMVQIGRRPFTELDSIERRTWVYDRTNEVWTLVYWPWAREIEKNRMALAANYPTNPESSMQQYVAWLQSNVIDNLVFGKPALEFDRYYTHLSQLHTNSVISGDFCEKCRAAAKKMEAVFKKMSIDITGVPQQDLKLLAELGVSKTVYALPFPETADITTQVWQNADFDEMFGEAYTRKQDPEHEQFLLAYRKWVEPVVQGLEEFHYSYPSNGSSEAIDKTISLIRGNSPNATIHVFEGEYEGPAAYAVALGKEVQRHPRSIQTIQNLKNLSKPGDVFYLSQPSGIDGNLWTDFDLFMKASQEAGLRVLVDLVYVGAVAKDYSINLNYPHIETVFFSLSKAFGSYYQRIGGAFSRKSHALLWGNQWFKNLLSLKVGTALLRTLSVRELPKKYLWAQTAATLEISKKLSRKLTASDVVILAFFESSDSSEFAEEIAKLQRDQNGIFRFSLTALMDQMIRGNSTKTECKAILTTE